MIVKPRPKLQTLKEILKEKTINKICSTAKGRRKLAKLLVQPLRTGINYNLHIHIWKRVNNKVKCICGKELVNIKIK